MSEFSFTDEPVGSNPGDEESAFSFVDAEVPNEEGSSEFTFGSETDAPPEQAPIVGETKPATRAQAKPTTKKPTSRVIGMKTKAGAKKTTGAAKKFGKKEGGKGFFGSKVEKPVLEAEKKAPVQAKIENPFGSEPSGSGGFDFGSAEPEQPSSGSGFDFGATEQAPPSNTFDFGASEPAPNQNAFDFGGSGAAAPSNAFDFGSSQPTPFDNDPKPEAPAIFDFNSLPTASPSQVTKVDSKPNVTLSKFSSKAKQEPEPEISEDLQRILGETCSDFVLQLMKINKKLENAQKQHDDSERQLHEMEREQSEALVREQFDLADRLNTKMTKTKAKIIQSVTDFNTAIADAMTIANDAPGHLVQHSDESSAELPQLKVRKSALDKRLANLQETQEADKMTIEIEKQKTAAQIEELRRPIDEHQEQNDSMKEDIESRIEEAKQPFIERISTFSAEKDQHNARIAELLAEIERHRVQVADLSTKIEKEQRGMEETIHSFDADLDDLEADAVSLETERNIFKQRVRDIEAPYQSLMDQVDKREAEIAGTTAAIEKVALQIDESEKDSTQCEKAAQTINGLCKDYFLYTEKRITVHQVYESSMKHAENGEKRRDEINAETIELRAKAQRATEFLNDAKLKIPQLEASKKQSVAAKNFRGAQQITKQIAALQDQVTANEQIVSQTAQKLAALEAEVTNLNSEIARSLADVEETSVQLKQMDYDFYHNSVQILTNLFELSPFGTKLLNPLHHMFEFALEHTEVPKQLTPEEIQTQISELNESLEKAVAEDDFDQAASLQEQIDTLTAKLEKLQSS